MPSPFTNNKKSFKTFVGDNRDVIHDSRGESSSDQVSSELADSVRSMPDDLRVIESKTVFYYSNFDLSVNEWFNEYENIELFKINMKKNLGNRLSFLS